MMVKNKSKSIPLSTRVKALLPQGIGSNYPSEAEKKARKLIAQN